eukprot:g3462.t1
MQLRAKSEAIREHENQKQKDRQDLDAIRSKMTTALRVNESHKSDTKTKFLGMQRQMADLEVKLRQSKEATRLKAKEVDVLREEMTTLKALHEKSLTKRENKFTRRVTLLAETIAETKKEYNEMARLKMGDNIEQLESLRRTKDELKIMTERATAAELALTEMKKSVENMKQRDMSAQKDAEIEDLRSRLRDEREVLKSICTSDRDSRLGLLKRVRTERGFGLHLQSDDEAHAAEFESLRKKLETTKSDALTARTTIQEIESRVDAARSEIESLREINTRLGREKDDLEASLSSALLAAEDARKANDELVASIERERESLRARDERLESIDNASAKRSAGDENIAQQRDSTNEEEVGNEESMTCASKTEEDTRRQLRMQQLVISLALRLGDVQRAHSLLDHIHRKTTDAIRSCSMIRRQTKKRRQLRPQIESSMGDLKRSLLALSYLSLQGPSVPFNVSTISVKDVEDRFDHLSAWVSDAAAADYDSLLSRARADEDNLAAEEGDDDAESLPILDKLNVHLSETDMSHAEWNSDVSSVSSYVSKASSSTRDEGVPELAEIGGISKDEDMRNDSGGNGEVASLTLETVETKENNDRIASDREVSDEVVEVMEVQMRKNSDATVADVCDPKEAAAGSRSDSHLLPTGSSRKYSRPNQIRERVVCVSASADVEFDSGDMQRSRTHREWAVRFIRRLASMRPGLSRKERSRLFAEEEERNWTLMCDTLATLDDARSQIRRLLNPSGHDWAREMRRIREGAVASEIRRSADKAYRRSKRAVSKRSEAKQSKRRLLKPIALPPVSSSRCTAKKRIESEISAASESLSPGSDIVDSAIRRPCGGESSSKNFVEKEFQGTLVRKLREMIVSLEKRNTALARRVRDMAVVRDHKRVKMVEEASRAEKTWSGRDRDAADSKTTTTTTTTTTTSPKAIAPKEDDAVNHQSVREKKIASISSLSDDRPLTFFYDGRAVVAALEESPEVAEARKRAERARHRKRLRNFERAAGALHAKAFEAHQALRRQNKSVNGRPLRVRPTAIALQRQMKVDRARALF